MPERPIGPGRILALVYGFFALAAGARSAVQLSSHFSRAPLAYLLSAVAAAVYLAGSAVMLLTERAPRHRAWAVRVCGLELAGVVAVGIASLVVPGEFPDATVWSRFGSGYAFVPLVLPLLGLAWLRARTHDTPGGVEPPGVRASVHDSGN